MCKCRNTKKKAEKQISVRWYSHCWNWKAHSVLKTLWCSILVLLLPVHTKTTLHEEINFNVRFMVAAVWRRQTDNVFINDIDTDTVRSYDPYLRIILNEGLCWEAHVSASQRWQCTTQAWSSVICSPWWCCWGLEGSVWRNHVGIR